LLTCPTKRAIPEHAGALGFESDLAAQESAAVTGLRIDSELRRGRDYVRVVIVATIEASDAAEAFGLTWQSFRQAADKDLAGWDLAGVAGEVRPAAPLRRRSAAAASPPRETANAFAEGPVVGDTGRVKLDDYLDSGEQVLDHLRHRAAQETWWSEK
jgi:hypothetical protein